MSTPSALAWSTENCTIGRAMTVLGERWNLVVLREVAHGIRRFDDIAAHAGVSRQVLSDRLRVLVEHDVLRRVPYQPDGGGRVRHEYRLTPKGFDLFPVMVAVAAWGDRYLADDDGPPVEFVHRDCGSPVELTLACTAGHRLEDPREVAGRPGPGVRTAVRDRR